MASHPGTTRTENRVRKRRTAGVVGLERVRDSLWTDGAGIGQAVLVLVSWLTRVDASSAFDSQLWATRDRR